ncbi:MAG TPA: sodium:solute symporter family protein [Candidatus Polarisedimenticolaceae bacterium]|nr:sodium:solute symporter family protein [Candidatus Polarisedimenticolaceae bacterium]
MIVSIIALYLVAVLAIGLASHRLFRGTGEDFFLATRTIGPFLLLMSLFGTHMTAFSLLGASAEAYRHGIGVFALMASSSAIVAPTVFLFVGVRVWELGKRNGFITQVQFFRDRFESDVLGLLLFFVVILLLIPYLLIGIKGGGLTLDSITGGTVPEWVGSLAVCLVVLCYVTYGGLRGTAWANTFQTLLFMTLGAVAFIWITRELGGMGPILAQVGADRPDLLVRGEHIPPAKLLTYTCIPLSVGTFPHIFMHWLTARRAETFRVAIVAYPLCVAVVWLPAVLLGIAGAAAIPGLEGPAASSVLVQLIDRYAPPALAGLLGAGVFAAIMSSLDSQVLALGTIFTQDIVRHYRFHDRMSERQQVLVGRVFVVSILAATYSISLAAPSSIFKFGIWSFTGFAALFPLVVAALFWRRSTGAAAGATALTVAALWLFFFARGWSVPNYSVAGSGIMPVAVILVAASVVMVSVSLVTRPPSAATIERFFGDRR